MTAIGQVFQELFFGSGFWLGFLLVAGLCIAFSYRFRYSGLIFEVILFFLAFEYSENLATSDRRLWGVILCFVGMIFIGIQLIRDVTDGR